jgi:hypothetical protein
MAHEWMLDSGFWKLGCRRGVAAAWILYSVFCILPAAYACDAYSRERRAERRRGVGRPDSVFCILYSAGRICTAACARDAYSRERRAEVCGPPGFCILYSVFCRPHMHVMHIHVSGGRSRDGT